MLLHRVGGRGGPVRCSAKERGSQAKSRQGRQSSGPEWLKVMRHKASVDPYTFDFMIGSSPKLLNVLLPTPHSPALVHDQSREREPESLDLAKHQQVPIEGLP